MKHRKRKIKIILCVNIRGKFTKALSSFLIIAKRKILRMIAKDIYCELFIVFLVVKI